MGVCFCVCFFAEGSVLIDTILRGKQPSPPRCVARSHEDLFSSLAYLLYFAAVAATAAAECTLLAAQVFSITFKSLLALVHMPRPGAIYLAIMVGCTRTI